MKNGKKDITKTYRPVEPEVSVIIPAYNNEASVSEAVFSVCSGDYSDFEIILVDDGSEDRTHKVCEELQNGDERIRLITLPHKGVSAARNAEAYRLGVFVFMLHGVLEAAGDHDVTDHRKRCGDYGDRAYEDFCEQLHSLDFQPVTYPEHGFDMLLPAELLAEPLDMAVERARLAGERLVPDKLVKPVAVERDVLVSYEFRKFPVSK